MELNQVVYLENETKCYHAMEMTIKLKDPSIFVLGFYVHTKATEKYVVVSYSGKEWVVPYYYRRTGLYIDTASEMVSLIRGYKENFTKKHIEKFKREMRELVDQIFGANSNVTKPIFMLLLDNCGEWICNKSFDSSNTQRRIQDIKESGFTLATKMGEGRKTYHTLLPVKRHLPLSYESFSPAVKKAIFDVHNRIDAYTGGRISDSGLPDHKFPEIRWTADVPVSNENLTSEEMRNKFQLVSEVVNQSKREVCRRCRQTGKRGMLNGINFFYEGDENWNRSIPEVGREAERGCVGCFWYDMIAWRNAINNLVKVRNDGR